MILFLENLIMPTTKYIIHLQTQGEPYIVKNKTEECEDLQELVGFPQKEKSYYEKLDNKIWRIHPLFIEANKYWRLAEELRKYKHTTYVNEEGISRGFVNNMGCISLWNANTLFGEVFICITKNKYDKVCNKLGYKLNEFNFNEQQQQST